MIGQYDEKLKGWKIVCDICGVGPLGHVAGNQETQPTGYQGFFCREHAPVIEEEESEEE